MLCSEAQLGPLVHSCPSLSSNCAACPVKEGLQDWNGAVQDYSKAIQALRPKDGRADVPLPGDSKIQDTWLSVVALYDFMTS